MSVNNTFSLKKAYNQVGVTYLGSVGQSMKMRLSLEHNVATYCIYLAPSNLSGYKVCPNDKYCKQFCLNGSGQNKADVLSRGEQHSLINQSRIKKTRLFYQNRDLFMQIMIKEIELAQERARKNNMEFSVRINGTSDLSPLLFKYEGKNILEWFPDVMFYDYTKVPNRFKLLSQYKNYDLTFSFNGYNWTDCEDFLKKGGKVAVVFDTDTLPTSYRGYRVVDANSYDMRYKDDKGTIMGLHYHKVANNYKNGHYEAPDTPFVVKPTDDSVEF